MRRSRRYLSPHSLLDSYPVSTRTKSVWALVTADNLHSDHRASVEVFLRDIYWREKPDSKVVVRKAAYLSALFVPIRWRGHGYARQLLHRVIAALRVEHRPPFDDVAVIYGSAEPGAEGMYRGAQWHKIGFAEWSPSPSPRFDLYGALPITEPVLEKDIAGLVAVAAERVKKLVVDSSSFKPCFAMKPDEDTVRLRAGNYRNTWKHLRPDVEQPVVTGARIGSIDQPSKLSFALWGTAAGMNSA